jgi:hypothetical protein
MIGATGIWKYSLVCFDGFLERIGLLNSSSFLEFASTGAEIAAQRRAS